MSYILEALKKSESERNQGRVPDLGQQIRMIHRKRRRGMPVLAWLAIALVLNAIVLAVLFWPRVGLWRNAPVAAPQPVEPVSETATADPGAAEPEVNGPDAQASESGRVAREDQAVAETSEMAAASGEVDGDDGVVVLDTLDEAPTVIVPTIRPSGTGGGDDSYTPAPWEGRVPHLVELPMAFQRRVPDLEFNSHVYSSRPSARSVMINNRYLRMGDSMGPLRVERITEEGVELSMDGQRFRVGVVRDWSSPR